MRNEYLICPFCPRDEWVSDEDPDSSFGEILSHIRMRHPQEDQTPSVLWPRIKISHERT